MAITQSIQGRLNDNKAARWSAMLIISFTMMCAYFVTDVMAPLEKLLITPVAEGGFGWTDADYGFFSGAYGYINVFLFMLFFGGIILDKCGVRFTGLFSTVLMLVGALLKYYAVSEFCTIDGTLFGYSAQAVVAALGFSAFGMGAEITGITVSKILVKWFTGHELALAMGLQVGMARIGTALALGVSLPVAKQFTLSTPVLVGAVALCIGLISYMVYCVMDRQLDASLTTSAEQDTNDEEGFHLSDLRVIFTNRGFWLIALLCLMFYAGVFPFLKYATGLMIAKYHVNEELAGLIPAMLPFGTIFFTPIFGSLYDRIGKGATLMIIGSAMLAVVHLLFAMPLLNVWWFAVMVMILLGIAFSLVPSALWPSVPKIIPMKQLGSAYAIIFYIQNIGLSLVPLFMGKFITAYCTFTTDKGKMTDYTMPMLLFALLGVVAVVIALMLKREDKRCHYGLEEKNMK